MKARSLRSRIVMVFGATLAFVLSATLAWAVVSDYQSRGVVPAGVTVAGRDLGGLTESQARATLENAVSGPLLSPVTVTGDGKTWALDPRGFVTVDIDAMLDGAYTSRRSATLLARFDSDVRGTPLSHEVKPAYSIDASAVADWVTQVAFQVDRRPVDATRTIEGYEFKIRRAQNGAGVDRRRTTSAIVEALGAEAALSGSSRVVAIAVRPLKPKVLESSFKTAIIVSLSECRIRLYDGAKLVKTYRCAPGRAAFPTPTGDFIIQSKLRYASWFNPGSAWAASMPKVIGPGPNNPMGVTKIGINSSGIFMHGVPSSEFGSIGRPASHGCMRMMPSDVFDLYGRVHLDDPVFIRN